MSFIEKAMAALSRKNARHDTTKLHCVAVFGDGSGVMFTGPIQGVVHRWDDPAEGEKLFDRIGAPTKAEAMEAISILMKAHPCPPMPHLDIVHRFIKAQ